MIRSLAQSDADSAHEILTLCQPISVTTDLPNWTLTQVKEELSHAQSVGSWSGECLEAFIFYRVVNSALWEIDFLATRPAARCRGVMKSLMIHLCAQLPAGAEIWLEVHQDNLQARRLYEKSGFLRVGIRPGYYQQKGAAILYSFKS